jgi:predicted DNA-binding ribbon-helix-helix protein
MSKISKKSITIANRHDTSVSLEQEFWDILNKIAKDKEISINKLVTQIDQNRETTNLSSAIRLYILNYLIKKAED